MYMYIYIYMYMHTYVCNNHPATKDERAERPYDSIVYYSII